MSQQTRTPRPRVGDGLVPLVVRVKSDMQRRLGSRAGTLKISVAELIRRALDAYFFSDRQS